MQLVKHYAGSHAYGTNTPESDIDIRGIHCADERSIRTNINYKDEIKIAEDVTDDGKSFELLKFARLALECNPNVIETLFVDPSDIIETTSYYEKLRDIRDDFISKRVITTHMGYAKSQLKRIKGHNKWINKQQSEDGTNPYDKEPTHSGFIKMVQNFTNSKVLPRDFKIENYAENYKLLPFSKDLFGLFPFEGSRSINDKGKLCVSDYENRPNPSFLIKMNWEEFERAHKDWKQYWEWRKNRNPQRSKLEQENQYDTKHASHVIRLSRSAVELNKTGTLIVKRPDAKELLAIRNGEWSYEKFQDEVLKLESELDETNSTLNDEPNIPKVWNTILEIQDDIWRKHNGLYKVRNKIIDLYAENL